MSIRCGHCSGFALCLAALLTMMCSASAAEQHLVFISDTQYPWTRLTDENIDENESDKKTHSARYIIDQAEATSAYRINHGGKNAVPLFISGDLTAFGHGWQREFMYDRPFAEYGSNTYPALGNHDYQNNVDNCANNGCARDMYEDMLGWAKTFTHLRDFDYSKRRIDGTTHDVHTGSLAYSILVGDVVVVQLQNEPTYQKNFSSNGRSTRIVITPSLDFLKRQLDWARASEKDVILSMHKPPYGDWDRSPANRARFAELLRTNKDLILGIFAGHWHQRKGRIAQVEGIPVYLSGASHYATWLTATYDTDERRLDVYLVQGNNWRNRQKIGTRQATASRDSTALPSLEELPSGGWGTWGDVAMCPDGQFVTTMQLRGEAHQGNGDDTALNAVRFRCAAPGFPPGITLESKEAQWGSWDTNLTCPGNRHAVGFRMQTEKDQGPLDDTGMGNLELACSNGDRVKGDPPASWGDWTPRYLCPVGTALAGFTSKVEDYQGLEVDDTALNRIQMFCRPL